MKFAITYIGALIGIGLLLFILFQYYNTQEIIAVLGIITLGGLILFDVFHDLDL